MNLEAAIRHIAACRESMTAHYHNPVFDEWVMVSLVQGRATVLHYEGPRADTFRSRLHADSAPLYAEMVGRKYSTGDFEFVDDAPSTRFDACVKAGPDVYLLCNNTYGSMTQIRHDPRWLAAQKPFLALTEKFRADPFAV